MLHQTMEKLSQMKLHTMATAFKEQLDQPSHSSMSFQDRFAMIVDREWTSRENRKLTSRLKAARLRTQATVEDIDYQHPRGLDKSVIMSLATCQWIGSHQNVIIVGPIGIDKTYLPRPLSIRHAVRVTPPYATAAQGSSVNWRSLAATAVTSSS